MKDWVVLLPFATPLMAAAMVTRGVPKAGRPGSALPRASFPRALGAALWVSGQAFVGLALVWAAALVLCAK